MHDEGWFQDPFQCHEDRWYSDGNPTKLVRDGGIESYDPPPSGIAPSEPLVRSSSGQEAAPGHVASGGSPNYADKGEAAATAYGPMF